MRLEQLRRAWPAPPLRVTSSRFLLVISARDLSDWNPRKRSGASTSGRSAHEHGASGGGAPLPDPPPPPPPPRGCPSPLWAPCHEPSGPTSAPPSAVPVRAASESPESTSVLA